MDELAYIQPPPALEEILTRTEALGFGMASEPKTGFLLRTLAASKPRGRILELGTGTGISTAWLLDGMDAESTLVTVDTDPKVQDVARAALGTDARLSIVTQDAIDFLRAQPEAAFDLVFADAMPGKYDGLADALRVVRPGGFYVIDDMLPQSNWPEGHAAKVPVLIDRLAQHPEFVITPMAWASGLVLAVKTRGKMLA